VPIRRDRKLEKTIAKERIGDLLERAEKFRKVDLELARRYVEIARKISMRYRVKIPEDKRLNFCKKCLYPYTSSTARVRIRKNRVIITCLKCGYVRRFPKVPKNVLTSEK
jgi:ribonuclease P protein subunit RPR2